MRYIFVTGGVSSSLGKGITAASIGNLLKNCGFRVKLKKLDPYLNMDPGTMNPSQHGEVFITEDGIETDLDLGHYERFIGINCTKGDNITAGRVYWDLLEQERQGKFLGNTVQVIPHVTDAIKKFIRSHNAKTDVVILEIGGTVGDIEGLPFLEAIRQIRNEEGASKCFFLHLTWVPWFKSSQEFKTKPTQHAVKTLLSVGIQPDALLLRSDKHIGLAERKKISLFCNVPQEAVINATDCQSVYEVPLNYYKENLHKIVCAQLRLKPKPPQLAKWRRLVKVIKSDKASVPVAVVGKYTQMEDCYKSLVEALNHGAWANKAAVDIQWIDSEQLERDDSQEKARLHRSAAILVPGGFGKRGSRGKMDAITYAREQQVPFLGICFGMQMAVLEALRNVANLKQADSTEFNLKTPHPVIGLLTQWDKQGKLETRHRHHPKGATMRLGAYPCVLSKGSKVAQIYRASQISERHRHRYEVNINYKDAIQKAGAIISGTSQDEKLPEIIERTDHPWFIGVQFHPELKSRPLEPHPLFASFMKAAITRSRLF